MLPVSAVAACVCLCLCVRACVMLLLPPGADRTSTGAPTDVAAAVSVSVSVSVLVAVAVSVSVQVFVHARNGTTKTAQRLWDIALREGTTADFDCKEHPEYAQAQKSMQKSPNKQLKEIFRNGFGTHHAGMLRSDRNLVERTFEKGVIKVLCCTATLAWGINLPAHCVVIKGTQIYNPERGGFVDLGVLDIQQIFGRAGRPQFDTLGEATMITTHDKLSHYLSLMLHAVPIESRFTERLTDHLNAEIALGTVSTVEEGMRWLSYTFLYPRMRKNPLAYGISHEEHAVDPDLVQHRTQLIIKAAGSLDRARMVRFNEATGYLHSTDLGRVASHFYIRVESIELFNEQMKQGMTEAHILSMISQSCEFDNINVRHALQTR
jgi:activating signal cointegrator complex subunit 3